MSSGFNLQDDVHASCLALVSTRDSLVHGLHATPSELLPDVAVTMEQAMS